MLGYNSVYNAGDSNDDDDDDDDNDDSGEGDNDDDDDDDDDDKTQHHLMKTFGSIQQTNSSSVSTIMDNGQFSRLTSISSRTITTLPGNAAKWRTKEFPGRFPLSRNFWFNQVKWKWNA